eukprot:GFUD01014148.1.p1 GENE.GFUD01014148.1~~GFUD01014148.1.p1  ORF type:complete len:183 (+),score=76.05 GFUD01014148.1:65-613(+)
MDRAEKIKIVRAAITEFPDFPKPGIMFQDIFGVLADPEANKALHDLACEHVLQHADQVDKVVGLDARGFLFGNSMALAINKPFVPIRKAGKLPGKCSAVKYALEYGEDTMEVQEGSIKQGDRVLVVDDLLATGGTLAAACNLIKKCGGEVAGCWVVIELAVLKGRDKVGEKVEALIVMEDVE